MAITGLSKPYCAVYSYANGAVSYSKGTTIGKAREANIVINAATDNDLWGDNGIAETDRRFQSGTITLKTTELSQEVSALMLGIAPSAMGSISGVTDTDVKELVYDDNMETPYLGIGFIIRKVVNGVTKWRGVILPRVMFAVPEDAAVTEESGGIAWQVPTITGTILRDESEKHVWKREATFSTEAQAEAYIKARLNVTA